MRRRTPFRLAPVLLAGGSRKQLVSVMCVQVVIAAAGILHTYPSAAQSVADTVERVKQSVAVVYAAGPSKSSTGTGFVVHPDGLLVTALHVVEAAHELMVAIPGRTTLRADVVSADPENDVAVLRVGASGLPALQLALQVPRVGEEILVMGYPLASILGQHDITVTRGIVSAVRPEIGMIQVDAAMNPGVSGGPVVNVRGEVVGMAVARLERDERGSIVQQVNFVVPGSLIARTTGALAGRPVAELSALRLPFRAVQEHSMVVRKGFPASSRGTELGAECVAPPRRARAITGVRGTLRVGDVLAIVWLSLREGVDMRDPRAFAHLGADGAWIPPRIAGRSAIALRDLVLRPERVCASFTYEASILVCLLCMFEARYLIEYAVLAVPGP